MMSVKQYALHRGITPRAVQLAIKNKYRMPGVERVDVVGGINILIMADDYVNNR
jgi:hypothetical protein